ncbi:MAG: DUF819 family protein [Pseudomonadota bacterium]
MITVLLYLLTPAAVIYIAHRNAVVRGVGVIILCYALGLAAGLAQLISPADREVVDGLSQASIALGLPLLLFSLDVRRWSRLAGKALLSLLLAVISVSLVATVLFGVFRDGTGLAANLAAMSVGVYSGGTPNLAAIKTGLDIPNAQYLAFHSLDTLVGALYLLFMLVVGVPLFRRLLTSPPGGFLGCGAGGSDCAVDEDDYRPLLRAASIGELMWAFMLSILVVILSLGSVQIWALVLGPEGLGAVQIIALTSISILVSLHPRVRAFTLSYRLGMYLIYVFCLSVASLVDLNQLLQLDRTVAAFVGGAVFAGLALHALLCRWAGVDADTFMVTSVAAVASPPFVPLMARALNNPGAMLTGMTTGVIGYALGSYLGISLGLYLRSF